MGVIATVVAGELNQVADPNQPTDQAYQSPLHPGERALRTLGESAHVTIVGGPTSPNGDVYWQIADDPFPGCCAPFGWVRESQSSGDPALAVLDAPCPDPSATMSGNQLLGMGPMEAAACFGDADVELRGVVRCDRPPVDSYLSVTGPDWANDQTLCNLDNSVALFGDAVTALYGTAGDGQPFFGNVVLHAHFNDPSSADCRWAPGNFMPIAIDNAPVETAQFACRMSVFVSSAIPVTADRWQAT